MSGHLLTSEQTSYKRQNLINYLEKHLSSVFSEKTSSEQDILGKHPEIEHTQTSSLGRGRAPSTNPQTSGGYEAPGS